MADDSGEEEVYQGEHLLWSQRDSRNERQVVIPDFKMVNQH